MAIFGVKLNEKDYYKLIYSKISFVKSNIEINILDIVYDEVTFSDQELQEMIKVEYTDYIKKETKVIKLIDFYEDYNTKKFKIKNYKELIIGGYNDGFYIYLKNINYKTIKRLTRMYKKIEKEYNIKFNVEGCGHCD